MMHIGPITDFSQKKINKMDMQSFAQLKKKLRSEENYTFKVVSDSMAPIINVGDEIKVDLSTKEFSVFDIIVFLQNEKLVCHVVLKKQSEFEPGSIITAPYKYSKLDFPVAPDCILGLVSSHKLSLFNKLVFTFRK